MEKLFYYDEEVIILFVALPDCVACRERIEALMNKMNCWKRVDIGYPSDCGTKLFLYYDKEDKEKDYWKLAEQAKRILQSHGYRIL